MVIFNSYDMLVYQRVPTRGRKGQHFGVLIGCLHAALQLVIEQHLLDATMRLWNPFNKRGSQTFAMDISYRINLVRIV